MTKANGDFSITAKHEAPQAVVTIIPEGDTESALAADDKSHLYDVPPELPPLEPAVDVHPGYGRITAQEWPSIPKVKAQKKKQLSTEDAAEYERLLGRVVAEPTSERAKQELLSFKALRGIA